MRIPEYAKVVATALVSACVGGFAVGKVYGADATKLATIEATSGDHETRIRATERSTAIMSEAMVWVREALRTGRDPVTGAPLPR